MQLEMRLYHYGLRAGFSFDALSSMINVFDVARHAPDLVRRTKLARKLLADSPWTGFIPKEKGYAPVVSDTLPGTAEALQVAREIIKERRKALTKQGKSNPVDHIEKAEDFRDHPELLNFALSDAMLAIVSDYYGMVPQLKEMGIWITREQREVYNSQYYHLDKPEARILALFMNVELNDEEKGPTTLLPADISQKIRRGTNYEARYYSDQGFVDDETIFKYCSRDDQISLGGPAGTGAFADTSKCFHFGSRCRSGERLMMMVKFMLPHKARKTRTPRFDLVPEPTGEIRRLALCGAAFEAR